jgi:Putative zinc-finger
VNWDHEEMRLLMGAYVLGGLDAADRELAEQHLRTCEACRDYLALAAPLPGLLRRLPGHELPPLPAPPELLPHLLDDVRADRQRRQRRLAARLLGAAAAVVAILLIGVGVAGRLGREEPPPAPPRVPVAAAEGFSAAGQAQLITKGWGTAIHLELAGLPARGPFALWVVSGDGLRQQAAAWGPTPARAARVDGATSVRPGDLRVLEVVAADGTVVASARPS